MGETRRKANGCNEFGQNYERICTENGVFPLATIREHSMTDNRLKFCCDRVVNHEDWAPILNALAVDRSLVEIHAYSRNRSKKIAENIDTEKKLQEYRFKKTSSRGPIIYTNFLLRCFVDAVAVCSRDSTILTSLSLDGIPLAHGNYLNILCAGLSSNRNIQNISLARCRIGNSGCELVLRASLENPKLQSIDFTACLLTSKSAHCIASFLRKRRSKILENAWHESDDRRDPNTEQFQSVHTMVLNKNRKFGDKGLRTLTETLKDDFWLKSLSLRRCGLTQESSDPIIDLLETNSTLVSINFKENKLPVHVLKMTRRLLKRRLEKGERISLRRRLIDRKKDLGSKRWDRSIGTVVGRSSRIKSTRFIITTSRKARERKIVNDEGSNLNELKERLSNLILCNRKLKRGLSNQRRLIVDEKCSRISTENSYRLMAPVIDKLRIGCEHQNRVRSRVLFENHLCTDIRKIFRDLETVAAINSKVSYSANPHENVRAEDTVVKKISVDRMEKIRTHPIGAQKRPHCPPRQKT